MSSGFIGGECWYCHWGWPKAVQDIYDRALERLDGDYEPLKFGPTHCLWEDENFGGDLKCYLQYCDEYTRSENSDWSPDIIQIVRESVLEMQAIPEAERDPQPADYRGDHPENFPPPAHIPWSK